MECECHCPACGEIMKEPRLLSCDHVFCTPCLEGRVAQFGVCPLCRQAVHSVALDSIPISKPHAELIRLYSQLSPHGGSSGNLQKSFRLHPSIVFPKACTIHQSSPYMYYCPTNRSLPFQCARCVEEDKNPHDAHQRLPFTETMANLRLSIVQMDRHMRQRKGETEEAINLVGQEHQKASKYIQDLRLKSKIHFDDQRAKLSKMEADYEVKINEYSQSVMQRIDRALLELQTISNEMKFSLEMSEGSLLVYENSQSPFKLPAAKSFLEAMERIPSPPINDLVPVFSHALPNFGLEEKSSTAHDIISLRKDLSFKTSEVEELRQELEKWRPSAPSRGFIGATPRSGSSSDLSYQEGSNLSRNSSGVFGKSSPRSVYGSDHESEYAILKRLNREMEAQISGFKRNLKPFHPILRSVAEFSDAECLKIVGTFGSGEGQLCDPSGVAVHPLNGKVYVADSGNNRIVVFSPDLQYLACYGQKGLGQKEFDDPRGIAFSQMGDVLVVVESKNHRVQIFDEDMNFIKAVGRQGYSHGHFDHPYFVTFDRFDCFYVSDEKNHRVQKFTKDGDFVRSIGDKHVILGVGKGICGVCINDANELIVLAFEGKTVRVYSTDGVHLRDIPIDPVGNFINYLSRGPQGGFLVSDNNSHTITFYANDGTKMKKLRNHCAAGAAFSSDGRFYATNNNSHIIEY